MSLGSDPTNFLFKKRFIFILCVLISVLAGFMSVECVGSLGIGVTHSYELLCGYWVLNLKSLEEQSLLSTAEPSIQPCLCSLSQIRTLFCGV